MDPLLLYKILQESIKGDQSTEILLQKVNDILSSTQDKNEVIDTIVDILVQYEVETCLDDKKFRSAFLEVVRSLMDANIVQPNIIYERFELDSSHEIGLIQDKKMANTLYNRARTRLYFKQKKYNLLREENEGFAKLIVQLSQLDTNDALQSVTEIIGAYQLDPNRVLDLIFEAFEYSTAYDDSGDMFLNLLRSFYDDPARLTEIIILKLKFQTGTKDEPRLVNDSFYRMLAIMIHREVLDLEDIYPYLLPYDGKILKYHEKLVEEGRKIAGKYNRVVVGDDKPQPKTVIETLRDEEPYDFHTLELDNQKINLCGHLLDLGDWDQASILAQKLPEYYCYSHPRVAMSMCGFINYLIDPLYRECALPKPLNSRITPIVRKKSSPPQVETIGDLQNRIFPMLKAFGPYLSADRLLLTKIIRLLKHILLSKQEGSDQILLITEEPLYYQVIDMINYSILPASSLSGSNTSLARELWSLIKNFKYSVRYKLYHEWLDVGSSPIMLRNKGSILLRAKHHMKRLSKETLRPSGRNIGKLCYSNPVITLNYVLSHIQSYENLINLVVDALRFLPPIALDALLYCILEVLLVDKDKKSADGLALAQWLINISNFSANFILRYKVEFTSFLEYIANQLKGGSSVELVLLTDLITKMTGIETVQAITDERIEAMMGGDVLRTEGAYFNQVKNTRKPSARLKEALIESRLAMPLCILIAQVRDSLFFNQQDQTPLKLIGKLYDQCQETLVQYGVFLSMNLSIDDYVNFLPSLEKLMSDFKLDPDAAFFLARPMIFHKIKSKFNELKNEMISTMQIEEGESPDLSPQTLGVKFVEATRSVIDPIAESVQPLLAKKYVSCNLNAKLFVIFWTLSMSDIEVPVNCYEREIAKLKVATNDTDMDPKKRKERERCASLINKLEQEQADQIEHTKYIRLYLDSEKQNLFCENSTYDNVYLESRRFVQHCPFARCILTAQDAIYSARFMLYLHELKVENYPTIICLDRLLCDLTYMMGACTENEANHYGRFLCHILKTTSHWHSSQEVYTEQCESFPGSIINIDNSEYISYETYRDICYKWHYRLTRSFSVALESNNYIQIRNALIVMISIIDYYPAIKHFGKGIGIKIEDVRNQEKESRQDLYALATAYAGRLDERKAHLIPESNFHTVTDVKSGSNQKDRHSSSSSRKKARHA